MTNQDEADGGRLNSLLRELKTSSRENAYHSLIELDTSALPMLQEAFRTETDPNIKAILVEAIWQSRQPVVIPFLAEALDNIYPQVWKAAIDGLVAILHNDAMAALESARHRSAGDKREWIDEAIKQVRERISE
jgi:hypothetical protein